MVMSRYRVILTLSRPAKDLAAVVDEGLICLDSCLELVSIDGLVTAGADDWDLVFLVLLPGHGFASLLLVPGARAGEMRA